MHSKHEEVSENRIGRGKSSNWCEIVTRRMEDDFPVAGGTKQQGRLHTQMMSSWIQNTPNLHKMEDRRRGRDAQEGQAGEEMRGRGDHAARIAGLLCERSTRVDLDTGVP